MARTGRAPRDALGGRILYTEPWNLFRRRRVQDLLLLVTPPLVLFLIGNLVLIRTGLGRSATGNLFYILLAVPCWAPILYGILRLVNRTQLVVSTEGIAWRRLEMGPAPWREVATVERLGGRRPAYRFRLGDGTTYVHAQGPFGRRHEIDDDAVAGALRRAGVALSGPVPVGARDGTDRKPEGNRGG